MTSQIVPGHALDSEGLAFVMRQPYPWMDPVPRATLDSQGSAKCECGAMSFPLPSARQRKQWHREHKDAVLTLQRMGLAGSSMTQCPANHGEQCCGDPAACHRTA